MNKCVYIYIFICMRYELKLVKCVFACGAGVDHEIVPLRHLALIGGQ